MLTTAEARDLEGFFQSVDSEIQACYEAMKRGKGVSTVTNVVYIAASQFAPLKFCFVIFYKMDRGHAKLTPLLAVPRCACWPSSVSGCLERIGPR